LALPLPLATGLAARLELRTEWTWRWDSLWGLTRAVAVCTVCWYRASSSGDTARSRCRSIPDIIVKIG
jgi:hypothetical protein